MSEELKNSEITLPKIAPLSRELEKIKSKSPNKVAVKVLSPLIQLFQRFANSRVKLSYIILDVVEAVKDKIIGAGKEFVEASLEAIDLFFSVISDDDNKTDFLKAQLRKELGIS